MAAGPVQPIGAGGGTDQMNAPSTQGTGLVVVSSELKVSAGGNWQGTPSANSRTIILHAVGRSYGQLSLVAADCASADGSNVFPADHISLSKDDSIGPVAAGQVTPSKLLFHFGDVKPGQYNGKLFLMERVAPTDKAAPAPATPPAFVEIPVTVIVKAGPWVPLIILVLSVVLSVSLALYRSLRQPQDQIVTGAGQLRAAIDADPELTQGSPPPGAPFRQALENFMFVIARDAQAGQWDAAKQALADAWALWQKWERERPDWIAELAHLQLLRQNVEKKPGFAASTYLQAIISTLDDQESQAAKQVSPDALKSQIDISAQHLGDYERLSRSILSLTQTINRINAPAYETQKEQYLTQAREFLTQLDSATPGDASGLQALSNQITSAQAQADPLAGPAPSAAPPALAVQTPSIITAPLPGLSQQAVQAAQTRLKAALFIGYGVSVFLIIASGFYTLYDQNATFGAAAFKDYFGLFAWGFGAETLLRSSIATAVTGLSLPGLTGLPILKT